jgi:hypothetical protein
VRSSPLLLFFFGADDVFINLSDNTGTFITDPP